MNTEFDPFAEPPRAPVRGRRSKVTGRPSEPPRFSSKAMFLIAMIASGVLVGAIWSLYPDSEEDTYSQNVPIVRAESKPMKVIPDDAGGMDIPHRDSTVFSALRPEEEERPRIENLLADDEDEEPLPRSQLFAGLNTEAQESAEQVASAEKVEINRPERVIPFDEVPAIIEEKVEEVKEEIKPEPAPEEIEPASAPAPFVKPKTTPKPEQNLDKVVSNVIGEPVKAAQPPVTKGDYYVQLASVKTRLAAESEWTKFKARYGLSDSYRIQQKDLGEKGIYFRIQSGPYPKEIAGSICSDIKKKAPGGCLVTK
ncbi:MAG: SPOR domain-containing protein [Alphaproteobacteria bacterium]|nr:SPOR domain-containing protein [Alphaproteobacteria bacterium]